MIGKRLFELYDQNRKAIILVVEANMLRSPAVLEEFRGLLKLETSEAKLVTFVLIGLLGSFTTFSTFGSETLTLIRSGRMDMAAMYAGGQVVIGVVMVWFGRLLAAGIWR